MKTQITSILVPTDFSKLSKSALKVGLAIAKRQNAEITLLHVVDVYAYLRPSEVVLYKDLVAANLKLTIEAKLKSLAGKIQKKTGVKIIPKVSEGTPSESICQIADEKGISLIVMGTHGKSGIRQFFIGSESFRVIKNATCPVLTVPGNWQKTAFEKVLFPVRLTQGALDKYFYARPIIEKNNSEVMLLGLANKKFKDELKEVTILMEKLKIQLYTDKVLFHTAVIPSKDFPATIINSAIDFEADLIILSANLDYNFKAHFIGPYAQTVINHSPLPVLTIKPSTDIKELPSSLELTGNLGKINFHF